jgi:hypothetical protein
MKTTAFSQLTAFLAELEQKGISYHLGHYRDDALMVLVAMPGERWEIEFLGDGSVEVEKFVNSGDIYGANMLNDLFVRYPDRAEHSAHSEEAEAMTLDSKSAIFTQ